MLIFKLLALSFHNLLMHQIAKLFFCTYERVLRKFRQCYHFLVTLYVKGTYKFATFARKDLHSKEMHIKIIYKAKSIHGSEMNSHINDIISQFQSVNSQLTKHVLTCVSLFTLNENAYISSEHLL